MTVRLQRPRETAGSGRSIIIYLKEWVYSGISVEVCDMALKDAIADAGITKLHFADYDQYSILGFVTTFTVTAYGE